MCVCVYVCVRTLDYIFTRGYIDIFRYTARGRDKNIDR